MESDLRLMVEECDHLQVRTQTLEYYASLMILSGNSTDE